MSQPNTRIMVGAWIALLALVYLTYLVVRPFWEAIAWSIIVASVSWPIFKRLRSLFGPFKLPAAILMGFLVLAAVLAPLGLLATSLVKEVRPAYEAAAMFLAAAPPLPNWAAVVPGLEQLWDDILQIVQGTSSASRELFRPLLQPGAKALAFLGDTFLQTAIATFTLFFLYYFGDTYVAQAKAVIRHVVGDRFESLFEPTKEALRSVFAGVILAAASQGLVAGIGYFIVGLKAPIILGIATGLLALVPFGAIVVWGSAAAGLLMAGALWKGVFILAWGVLLVSWVDNLVRPLVISGASRLPYLQTFFSLIGGLAAFGLIGLFLGPAILAVWMVLWQEWVRSGSIDTITESSSI